MSKKVKEYILQQQIGKGSFSSVWIAEHQITLRRIAIKQISKQGMAEQGFTEEMLRNEIKIHKSLKHDNIVRLEEYCETANNTYLFMEYCKDGDLQGKLNKLKKLPESEALYYLKQMMNACRELHKQGVIHRDLKPPNFLIDGDTLKICDFGFATRDRAPCEMLGSPFYMAPELLKCSKYDPYTDLVDVWSVGMIFYQMLFGHLPFVMQKLDHTNWVMVLEKTYRDHQAHNMLPFPSNTLVMGFVKQLLSGMLQVDPQKRFTWQMLFLHPLFSDNPASSRQLTDSLSTYLFNRARVDANFRRNMMEMEKQAESERLVNTACSRPKAGALTPSTAGSGSATSGQMLVSPHELSPKPKPANDQLMSEFAQLRLQIRPEDAVLYFQRLLNHEWHVNRLSTRLGHSCFQLVKELRASYPNTNDEAGSLAWNLTSILFDLGLAGLYLSMQLIGRHHAGFSEAGKYLTEVFPVVKDNKLALPKGFCEVVSSQSQGEWEILKKSLSNSLLSMNILGLHQSGISNQIRSLEFDKKDARIVQHNMEYLLKDILVAFFGLCKRLLELGKQMKKLNFEPHRHKAKEIIVYLSVLAPFYQFKDPVLTEYNTLRFLDRTKLTKTVSHISGLDTHHFIEQACFDWNEISNKSMSVEAMTESVRQLYQGLGFQDPTMSLLKAVPVQTHPTNPSYLQTQIGQSPQNPFQ